MLLRTGPKKEESGATPFRRTQKTRVMMPGTVIGLTARKDQTAFAAYPQSAPVPVHETDVSVPTDTVQVISPPSTQSSSFIFNVRILNLLQCSRAHSIARRAPNLSGVQTYQSTSRKTMRARWHSVTIRVISQQVPFAIQSLGIPCQQDCTSSVRIADTRPRSTQQPRMPGAKEETWLS